METEKEKLEREIDVLREAKVALPIEDFPVIDKAIQVKMARLAVLTTPQIKDGVLINFNGLIEKYNKDMTYGGDVRPLTIEELLPTLAQWVPGAVGAVAWEYGGKDWIKIRSNTIGWVGIIPAPPRDDWEGIGGEL